MSGVKLGSTYDMVKVNGVLKSSGIGYWLTIKTLFCEKTIIQMFVFLSKYRLSKFCRHFDF